MTYSYEQWRKSAEDRGIISKLTDEQAAAFKVMRSDSSPLVAKPELIQKRIYESFKLGTLAGVLAAAAGGAAGAPLGVPEIGAALGGYLGMLGGAIKGQADANKEYLEQQGLKPSGINLLRYMVPDQGAAYAATSILPESGHLRIR